MTEVETPQSSGEIKSKAVAALGWMMGGVVANRMLNLLMTVLLARILVPEDFGLVALATTALLMLQAITDLALGNALIHKKEITREDYDTAFTLGAIRGLLLTLVMIGAGAIMARAYGDFRLFWIMLAISVRPLMAGLASPKYVLLSKKLQFVSVAVVETIGSAAQLIFSVAIAYATQSYWGIVAGVIVAGLVPFVASYWLTPYRPGFSFASWRGILGFSVWITLNQIVSVVGTRFDNFVVAGFLGTATFGAYNVGNNIASMLTQQAIQPLERVFFPSFVQIADNARRLKAAFVKAQASLFAIGLPLGVGLALVAKPLVLVALGSKWLIAATVIATIAPILGVQVVFAPVSALAYTLGETRYLFNRGVWQMVIRVPTVVFGVYYYGLPGLLVARILSGGLLLSGMNMFLVHRLIGLSAWEQIRSVWRSIFSVVLMIGAFYGAIGGWTAAGMGNEPMHVLILGTIVGAIAYALAHLTAWLLSGRPSDGIEAEVFAIVRRRFRRG